MDTYEVKSRLILAGIDLEHGTGNISIVSNLPDVCELPTSQWDKETDNEQRAREKIAKVSGIDISWLQGVKLGGVYQSEPDVLDIIYTTWIPLDTPLEAHFWMPVDSVEDSTLRNVILRTIQQL